MTDTRIPDTLRLLKETIHSLNELLNLCSDLDLQVSISSSSQDTLITERTTLSIDRVMSLTQIPPDLSEAS